MGESYMAPYAAWGAKAHFGLGGEPPACDPMADSPPARECRCHKLPFCPSTAQKEEARACIAHPEDRKQQRS